MSGVPSARALRPPTLAHQDWRGGQLWTLGETTSTVRLQAEHALVKTLMVSNALLPAGAIVGDALACRVTGATSNNHTIAEIRGSRHADSPGTDQAGSVARGVFSPGILDDVLNLPRYWDWTGR